MSEKALVQLDKLLDGVRYDASREQLLKPFSASPPPSQLLEFRSWKDACDTARRNMAVPRAGGLGLTAWSDVGGLSRLEVLGLLTLALRTVAATPEVSAGPLFPSLHES
ncbi:hypothetical protein [Myxococcus eversor]|uniref:hypothetical protein n=1 Tax=Myxococcus eversor TaxID=2709661 RepID=UPI0013D1689D|nr:hypothetical protein [Myxococcus eversor]